MISLRDPAELDQVADPFIRALIAARLAALADEGVADDDLAEYIVVEAGDQISALEATGSIWITSSPFSDARYGDDDFAPCFEMLEEHAGHCFEMVHILNDSGFAVTTLVPDAPGIDEELIRFCREFATPSPDQIDRPDERNAYGPPG
jgi:hypothetical protein